MASSCYFQYEGKTRQVILRFEVSAGRFVSYDRGVDPETGQSLWGAVLGPYEFNKCQDFAAELPLDQVVILRSVTNVRLIQPPLAS